MPEHPHSQVDAQFMQAMIAHHAQALRMTSLVADRTDRADIALFAKRIEVAQADEIALMADWLEARGYPVPDSDHWHVADELMPGMLTEHQLTELAETTGTSFDRRFLELMIYHHEGALTMVEELSARGGGQAAEVFALATHIDADQRIELERMHLLLAALDSQ